LEEVDQKLILNNELNDLSKLNYILPTNSLCNYNRMILYSNKTKELLAFGYNDHGELGNGNQIE
jgi:hypothetical protein